MSWFSGNKSRGHIERMFIELDDAHKGALVYKWPDQQIRRGTRVTVDMDYQAVFTDRGRVVGTLGPGQHVLGEGPSALTSWLVDHITADGYFDTELFFVSARDLVGIKFGGPLDQVSDPASQMVFGLRVFGDVALRVTDPVKFLTSVAGTSGIEQQTTIASWVSSQVMAATREETPKLVAEHGILMLGSLQDATETIVRDKANATLAQWGLAVVEFGEFQLNVADADIDRLKRLHETRQYVQLAGGDYEAYARGEALRNMGAAGSDGIATAAMMNLMRQTAAPAAPPAGSPAASPSPAGEPTPGKFCSACGAEMGASAKFCSSCGTARA